jgi:hypothetical protein
LFVKRVDANQIQLGSSRNSSTGAAENIIDISNSGNDSQFFEYIRNSSFGTGTITRNANYLSFQLKIVLRHMTDSEMLAVGIIGLAPDVNIFPQVFDYRAIALT